MHRGIYGKSKREVAELLKESGINPTTQRIEIAHFLLQKAQHLSADEILQRINAEYEQVSQATVYNTLRLFVDKGVIRELVVSPNRIYYDSNTASHHHFLDVESGAILDIHADEIKAPNLDHLNAEIHEVSLLVRGRLNSDGTRSSAGDDSQS